MVPSSWSWTFRSVVSTNIFGGWRFRLYSWAPDIFQKSCVWLNRKNNNSLKNDTTTTTALKKIAKYYPQYINVLVTGTRFVRIPEVQTCDDIYVQIFKVQEAVNARQVYGLHICQTDKSRLLTCVVIKWSFPSTRIVFVNLKRQHSSSHLKQRLITNCDVKQEATGVAADWTN